MRRALTALCLPALAALLPAARPVFPAAPARAGPHTSPVALALLPGDRALTANHTAGSVSLVDLRAGKVLAELPCGRRPSAVAVAPGGRRAAVSNLWSASVSLFEVGDRTLKPAGAVRVGPLPRGLVFDTEGRLHVAVSGADEVVSLDPATRKVIRRARAPREPYDLALSPDGQHLAAASSRSGSVRLWEVRSGKLVWEHTIPGAFNLRGLGFSPDGRWVQCAHMVRHDLALSLGNLDNGWVMGSRLTRFAVKPGAGAAREQLALDTRGEAVGDPHGVAYSPDARTLAVTAGGTHELLLFRADALPWTALNPGDLIHPSLLGDEEKFRRIPLGGRPLALSFLPKSKEAVVANYLLDGVQVVDTEAGKVKRTIALGGPDKPRLARRGEAVFYDARRSHHQWLSCHTCHTDGHTCGQTFDTLNDDEFGSFKLTPSLRGVSRTPPWTWHGWQKDLGAAAVKSFTDTMHGPEPARADVRALLAFLGTLDHPPNPHSTPKGELRPAARRGKALFEGKARCARCHRGPEYTSASNYDVGLDPDGSPYEKWNPPSLRGLWDRGPFLHDGRAASLEALLSGPHSPQKLGGSALSPAERADLVAFLLSL